MKPTKDDLRITRDTLEYILSSTKEHEAYAVNSINGLQCALDELPYNPNDIEELS